jgi:hypothetical protein
VTVTTPAELLGQTNWWLPAPLARILPKASPSEDEPPAAERVLARAAGPAE